MDAKSIALGQFSGVAYYTVQRDGYEFVITVASGPDGQSIRYVATLTSGQNILLSVPQALGHPPLELEIKREGDSVSVNDQLAVSVVLD